MPFQTCAYYVMDPLQVSFFFQSGAPTNFIYICWWLLQCMFSTFRFLCGSLFISQQAQWPGFAPLQPFRDYPWQAYVHPCDGLRLMAGMHHVAAPSSASSRGEPYATQSAVLQPFQPYGWVYSCGVWQKVIHYLCIPCLLFQVWFHPVTWLTLNQLWA